MHRAYAIPTTSTHLLSWTVSRHQHHPLPAQQHPHHVSVLLPGTFEEGQWAADEGHDLVTWGAGWVTWEGQAHRRADKHATQGQPGRGRHTGAQHRASSAGAGWVGDRVGNQGNQAHRRAARGKLGWGNLGFQRVTWGKQADTKLARGRPRGTTWSLVGWG